ncbi:hypothetical protein FSP39_022080 [Pinctada imbricata]|uniref:FYVE-type domain-containing protein n=1 Tax=Pinctada imbricata TaxID=66713 RepID=A0AA88Y198_PINIB|nr:hypothetical protein FSP39_022080 [Pinctada imbricata]
MEMRDRLIEMRDKVMEMRDSVIEMRDRVTEMRNRVIENFVMEVTKTDSSPLATFFFADEELNSVAAELDSFDGRKDPERCTALVNKLRSCQDKVLVATQKIIDEAIPSQKASRDFRVKFPDDVLQENLAGQLWFGAECLAAGSSIMNREVESASMRPLARALTKNLDSLRTLLRDQCFRDINGYTERINEALVIFDKLFAEFELSYVSTMVPVKSMREYDMTQEITVLFSETVQRALKENLITREMIDDYDPSLMFAIPRYAIICGLFVYPEGPLNPDQEPSNISEMFRPFQTLLQKIKELLQTLTEEEMSRLVKSLCSSEESDKTMVQSHSDESSQTDASLENLVDSRESPVTPMATMLDLTISGFPMPESHETEDERESKLKGDEDSSVKATCLNKSESTDSGLHSENASTSDTISCEPQSVISKNSSLCSCMENVSADDTDTENASGSGEFSESCRCCKRKGMQDEVSEVCSDIVHQVVDSALDTCLTLTNGGRYSRQSSWQYNVNIEIPRSSVSDIEDQERGSSNSDSSTCTLSTSPFNCDTLTVNNADSENPSGCTQSNEGRISNNACDNIQTSNPQASSEQVILEQSRVADDVVPSIPSASRRTENDDLLDIKPCASNQNSKSSQKSENKSKKSIDRIHCRTGSNLDRRHDRNQDPSSPRIQKLRYPESVSSSLSSCHSNFDSEWDRESGGSSDTSSYNSESNDDEEIALAIQAAEVASRKEARSRFRSSSDLIHRLFVCISGVADQLQTNYAGDLRHILKCVFDMNSSEPLIMPDESTKRTAFDRSASFHTRATNRANRQYGHRPSYRARDPPAWVPDDQMTVCLACQSPFTIMRRRHHCRNCGKIYCGRCSGNFVPLPHFGFLTPVRVCNRCLVYQVTPFTVSE